MGGEGSGRSKSATDAVERLLAAKFVNDTNEIATQLGVLRDARKSGTSLMDADDLDSLTSKVVAHLAWNVDTAVANPRDKLGDVRADLLGGGSNWIEVKAQTMKPRFADITQADFIREGTDFLRSYTRSEPRFDSVIDSELREQLELDSPMTHGASWKPEDLWLADLALLVNDMKKKRARATNVAGLHTFLGQKYFLQFCKEGARIIRLDQLAPVLDILGGKSMHTNLKLTNSGNVASVQISAGSEPGHGSTDFTYHVGYKNAPGRHKLHDHAISRSKDLVIFRP